MFLVSREWILWELINELDFSLALYSQSIIQNKLWDKAEKWKIYRSVIK